MGTTPVGHLLDTEFKVRVTIVKFLSIAEQEVDFALQRRERQYPPLMATLRFSHLHFRVQAYWLHWVPVVLSSLTLEIVTLKVS